ncbi:MAG TPA: VWA domain-containing protein [Terriglobales bacterium]
MARIDANMSRHRRAGLWLIAFSLAMTMPGWPQASQQKAKPAASPKSAQTAPDDSLLTLRAAVSEVHVVFFVTDKHGHYVKNLTEKDFEIRDDHKPPQEILNFRSETDLPLEVGLLIDTSESVRDRFAFEKEAASDFLQETLRKGYDHAFVMGFDLSPKVTQEFTDDPVKLAEGIQKLQPGNLTAMYDAVQYACRERLLKQAENKPVRRMIVLLSDGLDNASTITRAKAIDTAQQSEVSVFAISTSLTHSGGPGYKNLESMAEATGGRSYVPIRLTEVRDAFAAVQENLRSQYSLSYRAADFKVDGHYRAIEIRVISQRGLHVHCRKGYRSLAPG